MLLEVSCFVCVGGGRGHFYTLPTFSIHAGQERLDSQTKISLSDALYSYRAVLTLHSVGSKARLHIVDR